MDEESLNLLTTDELYNPMIVHTKNMMALSKDERGKKFYESKSRQVDLIKKVLTERRANERPGYKIQP